MSYDSEQQAAKKARARTASDIEIDLRHVQRLQTDGLTNVAIVFCALTNPPAYDDIWRAIWIQAQENHQRAFEMLTRCADAVSTIAVYYPKLHNEVKEALAGLQLLTNCIRAITILDSRKPTNRPTESTPSPKSSAARPDPAALASLKSMSGDELRKALDMAADISIGHAVVLLEYLLVAHLDSRLGRLPKLSADAKGVELVPGVYLALGTAKVSQTRLAFAVRYLEVKGLMPTIQKPKLSAKWMDALDGDVAGVNHEELLSRIIGAR